MKSPFLNHFPPFPPFPPFFPSFFFFTHYLIPSPSITTPFPLHFPLPAHSLSHHHISTLSSFSSSSISLPPSISPPLSSSPSSPPSTSPLLLFSSSLLSLIPSLHIFSPFLSFPPSASVVCVGWGGAWGCGRPRPHHTPPERTGAGRPTLSGLRQVRGRGRGEEDCGSGMFASPSLFLTVFICLSFSFVISFYCMYDSFSLHSFISRSLSTFSPSILPSLFLFLSTHSSPHNTHTHTNKQTQTHYFYLHHTHTHSHTFTLSLYHYHHHHHHHPHSVWAWSRVVSADRHTHVWNNTLFIPVLTHMAISLSTFTPYSYSYSLHIHTHFIFLSIFTSCSRHIRIHLHLHLPFILYIHVLFIVYFYPLY